MNPSAKTIQIFLPTGDPQGVRFAEITTRIVQVVEVPRSLLAEFLKTPESLKVALYFLVGELDSSPKVYVGQTGDLRTRLASHDQKKEFWERALVLISRTDNMTQTHALFLEWYCLQATRNAARFADDNGTAGSKPHTTAPLQAECLEIFETGRTLLSTLGYPLFDPVSTMKDGELFYLTASGANGEGRYTTEGFVVLKGSAGRKAMVKSSVGTGDERIRQRLFDAGVLVIKGDQVVFTKDYLFRAPSAAATALMGRAGNGWLEWKGKDGRTLNEVKRSPTEDVE